MIGQLLAVVDLEFPPSLTNEGEATTAPQNGSDAGSAGEQVDDFLLLPPEERVLTLLEEYHGRMWQQDVVEETNYSEGRVSEVLSEMEADEQVTRYWKDGKKVVTLPEDRPEW